MTYNSFNFLFSWCLSQADVILHVACLAVVCLAVVCLAAVCSAAVEAYQGPPSAERQSHSAQRDPLLWCEWKEPCCCCGPMLFLATYPLQCRLDCWDTAGGLPVCPTPPPPPHTHTHTIQIFNTHPLIHHTTCGSQTHHCPTRPSDRKWGKRLECQSILWRQHPIITSHLRRKHKHARGTHASEAHDATEKILWR